MFITNVFRLKPIKNDIFTETCFISLSSHLILQKSVDFFKANLIIRVLLIVYCLLCHACYSIGDTICYKKYNWKSTRCRHGYDAHVTHMINERHTQILTIVTFQLMYTFTNRSWCYLTIMSKI